MILSLVAAVSANGVIGKNNQLPWHLPDDLKYFKQLTQHHTVVMGRKNFDSIPEKFRPLPNRKNIVLTRQENFQSDGVQVYHSFGDLMKALVQQNEAEVFFIGGEEIYKQILPHAKKLYITEIHADIEGDRFFPTFDKKEWHKISQIHHAADTKHFFSFDFVVYEKISV